MTKDEMPVGFAMALAMNPDAMEKFASMNEEQKQQIINGTRTVRSNDDMHRYVNSLLNEK